MDNFDYPAIGQRIKQLRKRKGLNQTELSVPYFCSMQELTMM